MQLALDELAANMINHGYGIGRHSSQITVKSNPDAVQIELVYEARPFDPLRDAPQPAIDAGVHEQFPPS